MPVSLARRRTAGDATGLTAPARAVVRRAGCGSAGCAGRGGGVGDITGGVPRCLLSAALGFAADAGFASSAATERSCGCAVLAASRSPGTFRRTRSDPTGTLSPISAPSQMISPSTGEGISTVALSVITAARVVSARTRSPTLTCHSTSSASAMPSPTSGSLITCSATSRRHGLEQRTADAARIGEVIPLLRMRIRRVPAGDTHDGRLEMVEAGLLHQRRQLRAEA